MFTPGSWSVPIIVYVFPAPGIKIGITLPAKLNQVQLDRDAGGEDPHRFFGRQRMFSYIGAVSRSVLTAESQEHMRTRLNPLNPNIKIEILISYPYTFSIEVARRIF